MTTAPGRWARYAALGDSLSEGLGDPLPGGGIRGWAALLAEHLRAQQPDLAFTNLAVRGYMAHHALARQLQPALEFGPDLVTVFVGGNDVLLRPVLRPEPFRQTLDALVAPFVDLGATVVMSTLPDLTACSPVPHPYRGILRRRLVAANAEIERVAGRHGTLLLDAWSDERTRQHRMWSIDRIHPSADGHRLIAASVATLLGLPVDPTDLEPRTGAVLADVRRHAGEVLWLARHGARRAQRRDGDVEESVAR